MSEPNYTRVTMDADRLSDVKKTALPIERLLNDHIAEEYDPDQDCVADITLKDNQIYAVANILQFISCIGLIDKHLDTDHPDRRPWADQTQSEFNDADRDYVAFLDWMGQQTKDRQGSTNLKFYQLMFEAYEGRRPGSELGE